MTIKKLKVKGGGRLAEGVLICYFGLGGGRLLEHGRLFREIR